MDSPLHYAAHFDKVTLVEEFLKKDQSAAYIAGIKMWGRYLFILQPVAIIQIMEKIIPYCPLRRNVLHLAVKGKKRKSVEHILKYYWGQNLVNEKDANGNTPLHLFTASLSFIPTLMMSPRDLRVDKMAVNKSGLTAADILSSNTDAPLLKGKLFSSNERSRVFVRPAFKGRRLEPKSGDQWCLE